MLLSKKNNFDNSTLSSNFFTVKLQLVLKKKVSYNRTFLPYYLTFFVTLAAFDPF